MKTTNTSEDFKLGLEAGRKETIQKVLEKIDEEIINEKEAVTKKIRRMNWTIVKELEFLKRKLGEK